MVGVVGALAAVPWGTIIDVTPAIIDGASKLLRSVGLMRSEIPKTDLLTIENGSRLDPVQMAKTIAGLEASLLTLNNQMGEATRLIGELAATNSVLTKRSAADRKWLWSLSFGIFILLAALVAIVFR